MKITRFAHFCILVESKGKRCLIDPGYIQYDESLLEKWSCDIILVTHKHEDHCYDHAIIELQKTARLFSTAEVAKAHPDLTFEIVKEGDIITVDGIKINVVKAVHGYIPWLKGDKTVHENIGFIIDDGQTKVYETSDSLSFENDYKCDILFVPVSNHGLVMGGFDAALFTKETEAKIVVPIHYHNPRFPVDLDEIKKQFETQGVNCTIMEIGDSIDI